MLHHRTNISSSSCPRVMKGLDGERAIIVRRKRLRLRQIKSLSLLKSEISVADGEVVSEDRTSEKRKRSDNGITSPRKKATANDVVVAGNSSCVGEEGDVRREDSRRYSHGSVSVIGRRREMEDAVASELGFLRRGSEKYDFYGVYDGHGGSRVAHACCQRLHKLVEERVKEEECMDYKERVDWEEVMRWSFRAMDDVVNKDGTEVAMMGSTAVVAVVGEEELVVANCGDSRAVICRDGMALPLSDDHKPDRPDELERIQTCGGKVINWNGQRVLGVLSTSRSIGDKYLKPFVIPDPEVRVMERSQEDEFLILASDGLWDVISNDIACRIVRKCLEAQTRTMACSKDENIRRSPAGNSAGTDADSRAARAAALLAELAIARGSRDNISVIVIQLKRPS